LGKALQERKVVVLDSGSTSGAGREILQQLFGMSNAFCQPIFSVGQGIGLLISANRKPEFSYQEDCLDLLKMFGKQVTIAIENDLLMRRAEELKVIDELTGLYNAGYMKGRLEEEIKRAMRYQRSCSLVVLNLDDFQRLQDLYGVLAGEGILHHLAEILKTEVTDVDRVGRMDQDEFAIILPEKNKREAIELAESIRRAVEGTQFANGSKPLPGFLTICAGVSENPLDGSSEGELFAKAAEALKAAKQQGKNKVLAA